MNESLSLIALWLSTQERLELIRSIANLLETNTVLSHEVQQILRSVQSELSVAPARDNGTKISFAQLRKVIGKEPTSVPVKLSIIERQTLIDTLELPIDLRHKLLA